MIRSLLLSVVALLPLAGVAVAQEFEVEERVVEGDVLLIERVDQTRRSDVELPRRGSLMSEVERRFGAPTERHPAVGGNRPQHPPITRWVYPQFSVYFEHDHVVNAVLNRANAYEVGVKPAD